MKSSKSHANLRATPSVAAESPAAAWLSNPWVACALLLGISVVARLPDLDQLARFDELYTMPAARGMMTEGVPRIADGVYSRAVLYTMLVGEWLRLVGDSLVAARFLSVLFGSFLAMAVFLWTDAVAGRAAAWVSGLFVALASLSIEMSQFARFYTLHALAFWLGAIGVYALATGMVAGRARWAAVAIASALCLLLALHLQILTLIGGVGLAAWLAGFLLWPLLTDARYRQYRTRVMLGVLALLVVLGVAAALMSNLFAGLLTQYLKTPMTVIQHRGEVWFYHLHLVERYPTLWPLTPFLAILAVAAYPKPSLFAICVFAMAFVLVSFGGQKSLRYVYFALPFLWVIWAIALCSIWYLLRDLVRNALDRVVGPVPSGLRPLAGWCLLIASFAFLIVSNGGSARTLLRPLGIRLGEGFSAQWPEVVPALQSRVRDAAVVVTSAELHMLYYLDRADIVLSKERLAEFSESEFARDPRTGLPVVSRPESLELILSCYPNGVIVTDTLKGWRAPTVIDDATANVIAALAQPIEIPERTGIKAFHWQTPPSGAPPPAGCAAIPGYRNPDSPG